VANLAASLDLGALLDLVPVAQVVAAADMVLAQAAETNLLGSLHARLTLAALRGPRPAEEVQQPARQCVCCSYTT